MLLFSLTRLIFTMKSTQICYYSYLDLWFLSQTCRDHVRSKGLQTRGLYVELHPKASEPTSKSIIKK